MKKLVIGIAIIIILSPIFLMYNHKQQPTEDDVFKYTKNWSARTEEVYLLRKIDGEWLTIFRDANSIKIAQLEQNWLGYWMIKNNDGSKTTLSSIAYPTLPENELNWSAGSRGKTSHYFGQITNPDIKKIEVETYRDSFEDALIINTEYGEFFLSRADGELVMPVNIRGLTETGKLIYSTVKPIKEGKAN